MALLLRIEHEIVAEELASLGVPAEPDWEEYFQHLAV
jgi:hypothetical protein